MPVYTAPDPSLVALNPMAATEGVMSSLKIKALLDKIASDKAAQEELAATRAARIGSQNANANRSIATDTAFTPLAGLEASTRAGQLAQTNALFKPQTDSMLAKLNLSAATDTAALPNVKPAAELAGKQIGADLSLLNPITDTKLATLAAQKGAAQQQEDLRPTETLAKEAKGLQEIKDAEDLDRIRVQKNKVTDAKLALALKSATSEEQMFDLTEKAKLEKIKAETEHLRGQVKFWQDTAGNKTDKAYQQLTALGLNMKRVEDEYKIPAYEDLMQQKNWVMPNPKPNTAIEKAIELRNSYRDALNGVIKKLGEQTMKDLESGNKSQPGDSEELPTLTPEQTKNYPKGTRFLTTDGREMTVK